MKFPLCMGKLYIHSCHALHFYRISTKCDDVCAIDKAEPFIRMLISIDIEDNLLGAKLVQWVVTLACDHYYSIVTSVSHVTVATF